MKKISILAASLSPLLLAASCGSTSSGNNSVAPTPTTGGGTVTGDTFDGEFAITEHGTFDEPWASAFVPGTSMLFITERPGTAKIVDTRNGNVIDITGLPVVDYGGQGGLGDVAFLPSEADRETANRTIYLSWAEAGQGDTRGAVVGRGQLLCIQSDSCSIEGLEILWRQTPKVTGRGHYSHRIAFSPDERYMFVASGERQKGEPAQDTSNTLGTIVRLNLDGTPAAGNPLADRGSPSDEIWSWGHRNILGLDFDSEGRLWEVEHGPKGGDELNLVKKGANYGWPVRSNGVNYDGSNIPDHSPDDGFEKFVVNWTPVIAPGNMVFYSGTLFPGWNGDLIMSGLKTEALIRVDVNGTQASEAARYDMGERIRSVIEGPDGALWVLEDGENGRLLELRPG
ncbi:PQQ-dependent sugar dehydrogenase [Erythrobacter litoralis]|uniref:PQQ-dependent sugar dehydrogenase n=1 Tax=Erythrobacter litoralis TaxID=39960 RepID=UPI0024350116|nr:PQQ-dependent sugar dehydrogenase [Erythrobacter litoralis]MDG6078749.1 PQQ-dependent sugar dehydrogenase [Erythrobacter litoralis]